VTTRKNRWVAKVKNRFHASAGGIVYQERRYYRQVAGFQESLTEGPGLWHAHAHILHKPGGKGLSANPPERTGEGKNLTLKRIKEQKAGHRKAA